MGIEFTNAWEDRLLTTLRESGRLRILGQYTKAARIQEQAREMLDACNDIDPSKPEEVIAASTAVTTRADTRPDSKGAK
jgi:hypothetical protein